MQKILALFLLLCLCACAGKTASEGSFVNGKPRWYWQPSYEGSVGGVGEAGFHVNGPSGQRQLATMRAIEDIARQKGITVQQVQEIRQISTDNTNSTSIDSYSIQTVDGVTVKAVVREVWKDPETGNIIVWATEVK